MKNHVNIPIFIPHLGCKNMCVFCNQRTISGVCEFDISNVRRIIDDALATVRDGTEVEIAFFGGSFTGIDYNLMISLLEIAYEYIKCGKATFVRCSTRPDYINEDILTVLKKYGVRVIELGLQSVDEDVLNKTKRGHSFLDEDRACRMIVDYGFELVGQMMIGLPGSTLESEIKTCDFIISKSAKGARIYPTVVFRNTELCELAMAGKYTPLQLEDAIERSAVIYERFRKAHVNVIRIGLCASENLADESTYYGGPNHPALGELVINRVYFNIIKEEVSKLNPKKGDNLLIFVSKGSLSKAIGQNKINKKKLTDIFSPQDISFIETENLNELEVSVGLRERK